MKIFVRQIPETGMGFDQTVTAQELDIPEDVITCLGPLVIHGDFEHAVDEVIAKFEVRGKYRLSCVKCLEDFDSEKTDQFELIFDIEPATEFIDISNDVRDEIILAASFNPLCREDCKGLCVGCGEDLNKGKCTCNKREKVKT